jgi:hypothetical protein
LSSCISALSSLFLIASISYILKSIHKNPVQEQSESNYLHYFSKRLSNQQYNDKFGVINQILVSQQTAGTQA